MVQQASPTTTPEKEMSSVMHLTFVFVTWKLKVKVAQSCPTLCNSTDYTVHGILQARILEWVDFPLQGSFQPGVKNPGLPHCRQTLICHIDTHKFLLTYVRKWAGNQVSWGQQELLWDLKFHFCVFDYRRLMYCVWGNWLHGNRQLIQSPMGNAAQGF